MKKKPAFEVVAAESAAIAALLSDLGVLASALVL